MTLVEWAEQTARELLADALPRRWTHVRGVAARAGRLALAVEDGEVLQAAAWLHDIGYAPGLVSSGFHPLDGARHLAVESAPRRVVDLVVMHSAAAKEAEALGLGEQLAEFHDERTLVRDLLRYADMTVRPDGQSMNFEERMDDVRARYPIDHYVIRALNVGMVERRGAIRCAEELIERVGLADHV